MVFGSADRVSIIYDNHCSMCTLFARCVGRMSGGRFVLVGHYSRRGEELRNGLLGAGALEMFWLIDKDAAYGGRAAILPLLAHAAKARLSAGRFRRREAHNRDAGGVGGSGSSGSAADDPPYCESSSCSGPGDVFIRSASLIRNSRTVRIDGRQA